MAYSVNASTSPSASASASASGSVAASASTGEESRPNVEKVRSWLDSRIRVRLNDNRFVEGHLECYDKLGNIILGDAHEIRPDNSRFPLGLVLAPEHAVTKIFVSKTTPENQSDLLLPFRNLRINQPA